MATTDILAPATGTVAKLRVAEGAAAGTGSALVLVESMKMEFAAHAPEDGTVHRWLVVEGESVTEGQVLGSFAAGAAVAASEAAPLERPRRAELAARRLATLDEGREEAVAKRHATGRRTARENLDDLVDAGSFVEYGQLAYAAQTRRREVAELIARTPADGLVGGIATVNAEQFGDAASVCAVSYDYTVLAGTQGQRNHRKQDRLFELAERLALPTVLFAEGGGGRPGDTDTDVVTGLDTMAFALFARLAERVPTIGIGSGRCFAGNAALLGTCDLVVATKEASIGMGGPAMIEGGGLGVVAPDEVGPVAVHESAGSVDLVVEDDAAAVAAVRQLLSYAQGCVSPSAPPAGSDPDAVLPSDRRRAYEASAMLEAIFDDQSVVELRAGFGRALSVALARLEGRPVLALASNPAHLAGAIDADAAAKATWAFGLANAWKLPVVSLIDTPGFMVGPEAEAEGLVRLAGGMFRAAARLEAPVVAVVTRRGYGLGAQALATGSFWAPLATFAWPEAELGGMGLEGAVKLGFRRELEAIADEDARQQAFDAMVAAAYDHGSAINVASHLEVDDVIEPGETRAKVAALLRASS